MMLQEFASAPGRRRPRRASATAVIASESYGWLPDKMKPSRQVSNFKARSALAAYVQLLYFAAFSKDLGES